MLVLLAFPAIAGPNQPIRWIVPSASGGSAADSLARQLAPVISRQLGQPLTVDNRPGAAGSVGSSLAARAAADGNTLLTGDVSTMVLNGALYKKQGYKAADFAPVGLIASSPLLLVVHKDSGFSSGAQWLAEVTGHPGKYSYASAGVGSPQHLAMELIMQRCRCSLVHVPYRAESFVISDLLVHALPMAIVDLAAALPELRKGRLQALAVLGKQRQALLPGVPTFEELGLKGVEAQAWQGLFVPKGTPEAIIARLNAELNKTLSAPAIKSQLEASGLTVTAGDSAAMTQLLQQQTAFWLLLIKDRKLATD
jgi:tripartite-type tricarboxylate transporter receptor subunit TctC